MVGGRDPNLIEDNEYDESSINNTYCQEIMIETETQLVCNIQRNSENFPEWIIVFDTPIEVNFGGDTQTVDSLGLFGNCDENGINYSNYEGDYVTISGKVVDYRGVELFLENPTIIN